MKIAEHLRCIRRMGYPPFPCCYKMNTTTTMQRERS